MTRFTQSYNGEDMDAELTDAEIEAAITAAQAYVPRGGDNAMDPSLDRAVATAATRKALWVAFKWFQERGTRMDDENSVSWAAHRFNEDVLVPNGIVPWPQEDSDENDHS